jgi:enamine deaminase RidA (YjgF/YER057c/UK114 family)
MPLAPAPADAVMPMRGQWTTGPLTAPQDTYGVGMKHLQRPDGLPPVNGYSHVVSFAGLVAVSGQVPMDQDGRVVGIDDPAEQIRQVFRNLDVALSAVGSDFARVVKLTIYLTDLADLAVFREIRDEYLDPSALPASTLVQVKGLINPAFRIEIDALAVAEPE